MAQVQTEGIVEGEPEIEISNLKDILEKHGFKEYDKIDGAVERKEITLDDLLFCSQVDLSQLCHEYGVSVIQKNRFIAAIKSLPNAQCSNETKQNTPFVFLTTEEQNTINKFDSLKHQTKQAIENAKQISLKNETILKQRQQMINQTCDKLIKLINDQRNNAIVKVGYLTLY